MQRDRRRFAPDAAGGKGDDQDADEAAHHWQIPEVARCRFRDNRHTAHAGEDAKRPWSIFGVIEEEGKEMNYSAGRNFQKRNTFNLLHLGMRYCIENEKHENNTNEYEHERKGDSSLFEQDLIIATSAVAC